MIRGDDATYFIRSIYLFNSIYMFQVERVLVSPKGYIVLDTNVEVRARRRGSTSSLACQVYPGSSLAREASRKTCCGGCANEVEGCDWEEEDLECKAYLGTLSAVTIATMKLRRGYPAAYIASDWLELGLARGGDPQHALEDESLKGK